AARAGRSNKEGGHPAIISRLYHDHRGATSGNRPGRHFPPAALGPAPALWGGGSLAFYESTTIITSLLFIPDAFRSPGPAGHQAGGGTAPDRGPPPRRGGGPRDTTGSPHPPRRPSMDRATKSPADRNRQDERLVPDARDGLSPSDIVENKLLA